MPRLQAANNAVSTLAASIGSNDTSLSLEDASSFPDPPFRITINAEVMEVGAKSGNTFSSIQRGLEGSSKVSHDQGDYVENRWTAGTLAELADHQDIVDIRDDLSEVQEEIGDVADDLDEHKAEKAQQAHGENLELIASVSLNSEAQIHFVNIPQTYKHLKLILIGRVNVAVKDIVVGINLNDVRTQSYNTQRLISAGTQITSAYSSETVAYIGKCPGIGASSDKQNGFFEIDILDYSGTKRKSILARYTSQLDDGVETGIYSTFTTIEEGINKISIAHWWQVGTIASLYGVRG